MEGFKTTLAIARWRKKLRPVGFEDTEGQVGATFCPFPKASRPRPQVTVLEMSDRVGGRIWTYRPKGHDWYAELGAMRLPPNHR